VSAVEPFDRSLPSPIADVLELRASSRDSVIVTGELTDVQRRMRVETGIGARILERLAGAGAPTLVMISGSAGGGKSLEISALAEQQRDAFDRIIEDATHAESPSEDQYDRLVDFFAPFADDAPPWSGKPRLIAMNTGMVIRFFDQVRDKAQDDGNDEHRFMALEWAVRERLDLRQRAAAKPERDVPILVVNLDLRATAGAPDSLFKRMLASLDPDDPGGVMGGAPRCATCQVRDWCFVRTNAQIASAGPAAEALDGAAAQIALERGRFLQPRALWDLAAEVVTGGEQFDEPDPCDRIATLAAAGDPVPVWRRLISNGAFASPRGATAPMLHELDPSYQASDEAHEIIARTGIDHGVDGDRLRQSLGGGGREAVEMAARALAEGRVQELEGGRIEAGRGLVRAAALAGEIAFSTAGAEEFRAALAEYREFPDADSDYENLLLLRRLLARALARAFGEARGADTFFRTEAYDPRRDYAILVRVDVEETLRPAPDRRRTANPDGAGLVDYEPLAVTFELEQVRLDVDLPLYRLAAQTMAGTTPSSADLERFYGLRRAAEVLGRVAADDHDRPLLISERATGSRFRVERTEDFRGRTTLTVRSAD
jgi:hypothetical protein